MKRPELPDRSDGDIFADVFFCLAIGITSLVGNILVVLSVYRNPRLRTTTNLYVIALATSDLIAAVLVMPLSAGVLISGKWVFGDFMCDVHAFFLNFVLYVSPSTMALTAVNRYVRIVRPSKYKSIFSPLKSRIYLGCVWLFVACYVAVPKLSGLQTYGFIPGYALCHVLHLSPTGAMIHYCFVISFFLLFPLITAIISYSKVSKSIRTHTLGVASSLQSHSQAGNASGITSHEIKVSKSLFVVVLAFVSCWIPAWAAAVVIRFKLVTTIPRGVQLMCSLFIYASSAVNPFIYAGMNRAFRKEFKSILRCGKVDEVTPLAAPPKRGTDETPLQGSSQNPTGAQGPDAVVHNTADGVVPVTPTNTPNE